MKILQISSARSIGGGERHVVDLSNELTKRGHDIFVAVVPGSPLPTALSRVPPGNMTEFPLRNAFDVSSAIKIGHFAKKKGVELINSHFAKDYPVGAVAARIAGVPLVITRHVLFPMNRLHRFFLSSVKNVIAPSNAVAESLRKQDIFPVEKIKTIRYGLDIARFPERRMEDREGICIGSIGNLDRVKGFDVLIRAAGIISKLRRDVRYRIVGEDRSRDGQNETFLRGLIAELNLNDSVELSGWSNDIRDVLASFDIFVSASRSESFGFVIAEAMLSGLPVIATETEGAKELISDPSLGQLLPIDSPERLGETILELLNDKQKREQLTRYGRDHVTNKFSLQRMVDETEALYKQAIADD